MHVKRNGPPAPVLAAVEAVARCIATKGSTLPWTMQNAILGARGASPSEVAHAERRWRRDSAAAHEGEGTLLAAGPREARSYSFKQPQQFHVELPHLHSQQQTLSTASRVEQA